MNDQTRAARPIAVPRVSRPSTVDLIATELRTAIMHGALPVGSQLGEVEIATQLGVSRSPFREAAQRLVQEGLLVATPGRGLRVRVIGPDGVADLYEARIAVETHAVRRIVAAADGHAGTLEAALEALEAASRGEDAQAIGDADLAFHRALVDAAGSPRLSKAMTTLAIETRIASLSASDGYVVRRTVSPTYRQLLEAIARGDAEAAVAALTTQLEEATRRLVGDDADVETIERVVEPPALQPIDPEVVLAADQPLTS